MKFIFNYLFLISFIYSSIPSLAQGDYDTILEKAVSYEIETISKGDGSESSQMLKVFDQDGNIIADSNYQTSGSVGDIYFPSKIQDSIKIAQAVENDSVLLSELALSSERLGEQAIKYRAVFVKDRKSSKKRLLFITPRYKSDLLGALNSPEIYAKLWADKDRFTELMNRLISKIHDIDKQNSNDLTISDLHPGNIFIRWNESDQLELVVGDSQFRSVSMKDKIKQGYLQFMKKMGYFGDLLSGTVKYEGFMKSSYHEDSLDRILLYFYGAPESPFPIIADPDSGKFIKRSHRLDNKLTEYSAEGFSSDSSDRASCGLMIDMCKRYGCKSICDLHEGAQCQ